MANNIKITIAIPAYNAEKTIDETLISALNQTYPLKEILVLNDGSTDKTTEICRRHPEVRLIHSPYNKGIGLGLERLMHEARGKYVVYLCADDLFTNHRVTYDIVRVFDSDSRIGVIGRYYYQFMDGYPGPIMVCRDKNIITSSCNPSGMAFRRMPVVGTNQIFIEMPTIVTQYLLTWTWTMLEYDTIAARIHPGGNTGTKAEYYKGSQIRNWVSLVGEGFRFNQGFIQIKNRAPGLLWQEIKAAWTFTPGVRWEPLFYFYVGVALLFPGWILRPLANFYRHRVTRHFLSTIDREEVYAESSDNRGNGISRPPLR